MTLMLLECVYKVDTVSACMRVCMRASVGFGLQTPHRCEGTHAGECVHVAEFLV